VTVTKVMHSHTGLSRTASVTKGKANTCTRHLVSPALRGETPSLQEENVNHKVSILEGGRERVCVLYI